jgi:ABC-2 type transport system permease protein
VTGVQTCALPILELRSREMKMRLLDKQEIKTSRTEWQLINIMLPILIVIAAGIIYSFVRRRKYARFR